MNTTTARPGLAFTWHPGSLCPASPHCRDSYLAVMEASLTHTSYDATCLHTICLSYYFVVACLVILCFVNHLIVQWFISLRKWPVHMAVMWGKPFEAVLLPILLNIYSFWQSSIIMASQIMMLKCEHTACVHEWQPCIQGHMRESRHRGGVQTLPKCQANPLVWTDNGATNATCVHQDS